MDHRDRQSADDLLPLVYEELERLAQHRLSNQQQDSQLEPAALVHEAYLRLTGSGQPQTWDSRGHFFAAAAEAMRRILVENARRKQRHRHGGRYERVDLHDFARPSALDAATILAIDESLAQLQEHDSDAAVVVKLHTLAGFTLDETAEALELSRATTYRHWAYAREWLESRLPKTMPRKG